MQTQQPKHVLRGHLGIVYALDWFDNNTLVTASSDHTAIVWFLDADQHQFRVLPHPSYLYAIKCMDLSGDGGMYVVTGGRDAILRIWHVAMNKTDATAYTLVQELEDGHRSYITAIVSTDNSDKLYSADMSGVIAEWTVAKKRTRNHKCLELKR